jgi:hypothetical protein
MAGLANLNHAYDLSDALSDCWVENAYSQSLSLEQARSLGQALHLLPSRRHPRAGSPRGPGAVPVSHHRRHAREQEGGKTYGSKRVRSTNPSWHGKKQLEANSPELVDNEERAARAGWPAAPESAAICRPRLNAIGVPKAKACWLSTASTLVSSRAIKGGAPQATS